VDDVAEPVALSNKQVLPLETAVLPKILALLPYPVLIFFFQKRKLFSMSMRRLEPG